MGRSLLDRVSQVALLCALMLGILGPLRAQSAEEPPNSLMMKTDLLVVTAHPDDEGMMAATMARYADQGKVVSLVTCTHGEGGGNGTGKEYGVSLGIIREAELRRCLGMLGVKYLYFLNQPDWAYTESVQATLARWGHDESLKRLVRLVRILRPEVVCTMDPAPVGGQHGHHQAAGRLATEAFEAAANPQAFPELIHEEGLSPWRIRKLYWVTYGESASLKLPTDGVAQGALAIASPGKTYAQIALDAESSHRSQGFDKFLAMMAQPGQRPPTRPESFLLVKSRVPVNPAAEKDLFDGIAGANVESQEAQHDILAASLTPANAGPSSAPPVEARIQPSQPVRNYRDWLAANGIARLMARLPAHVPVTQGAASPVVVEVINHTDTAQAGQVALQAPAGWNVDAATKPYQVGPHGTAAIPFRIAVPADAKTQSYDVIARIAGASETAGDIGQLDSLPQLVVAKLGHSLPVDADVTKWERAGVQPMAIPPTNLVQGEVKGPQECSGRFFVGYTPEGLQVLVDVTDNTVVANIAPDDIRGHWRTTSTEICIDPTPRSENTFGAFKLGIFPQDITGHVRAARDADANPGPVEEKDPGIQLASQRTPTGYIVEARIPWTSLGSRPAFHPHSGRPLGFNVILYHAGKKEARVGEDVGKSRLAWSFWPGVPGRPIVWGTAILQ